MNTAISDVNEYIKSAPKKVRIILQQIRSIIRSKAPQAEETISYGMPAYKINKKPLIYFAAFNNHIGLYATPGAHKKFAKQLSEYKQGKGSVQFPIDKPIPFDLIAQIVEFKLNEIDNKNAALKKEVI